MKKSLRLVSVEGFDHESLVAAIFAETNYVRTTQGLPPLRSHAGLSAAASFQSMTNSIAGHLSHENPFYGRATVVDRVQVAGVRARAFWENVAFTSVRRATPGANIVTRQETDGARTYLDGNTGAELRWPSYGELTRRIVRQWMDSLPHRDNIFQAKATNAVGARREREESRIATTYSKLRQPCSPAASLCGGRVTGWPPYIPLKFLSPNNHA